MVRRLRSMFCRSTSSRCSRHIDQSHCGSRGRNGTVSLLALVLLALIGTATAADDTKSSREREMLRRAQEALRQTQSENETLSQGKTEAEKKLKAATDQAETIRNASKSEQTALRAKLKSAAESQAGVAEQLEQAKRQIATLTSQIQEATNRLGMTEGQLKLTRQDLETSRTAIASCETKNLKLYEYSQQLAQRYEKKGVFAVLANKEPVLGISKVKEENVLQEYQDKFDSQRIQSKTTR